MDENDVTSKDIRTSNQSILISVVAEEHGTELAVDVVDG
jgi:hypothetical protein